MFKFANTEFKNKAIFYIIFAFFFILPAFNGLNVYNSGGYAVVTNDYHITSYTVNMDLQQNNVLNVQEQISVFFNKEMQGIVRAIPTFQTVSFLNENGKKQKLNYTTTLSEVNASTNASVYYEDGFAFIKLGDAGVYLQGSKQYTLSYALDFGDDRIKEFDQFYYNVIGHDWDTTISNISFTLRLPKQIDESEKLTLYLGKHGATDEQTLTVESDLRTFSWSYSGTLNAFEGVTARIVLDKNYFTITKPLNILNYVLLGVFVLIIGFLLFKIIKHNKAIITPVVMFTPPENLPPSELGYLLDGSVENKDISSLIVYWAQKGFITIHEENKNFTLTKNSEINQDARSYEKSIFNKIFSAGDQIKLDAIGAKIWAEVATAKVKIKTKHSKHFNDKKSKLKNLFIFLSAFTATFFAVQNTKLNVEPYKQLAVTLIGFVSLIVLSIMLRKQKKHFKKSNNIDANYLTVFLPVMALIFFSMFALSLTAQFINIIIGLLAVLTSLLVMIYAYKIEERNPESFNLLGEIVGFKQFITLTEKDKLKLLAKQNPEMFYDVLPYAHVLGVSNVWMNKFEHIAVAQPSWLVSQNFTVFDYIVIRSMLNTLMFSTLNQTSYASQLNSTNTRGSSGGSGGFGSGGGGFSGGGFGGGGGRGW